MGKRLRTLGCRPVARLPFLDRFSAQTTLGRAIFLLAALGCGHRPRAQCGVASLVNVLGRVAAPPVRYAEVYPYADVVEGHATFEGLARAAGRFGTRMRGYRLESARAFKMNDLGVVELASDHFVALVGREGDAYLIVDSRDGEFREPTPWSAARLEAEWTGHVLLVERVAGP